MRTLIVVIGISLISCPAFADVPLNDTIGGAIQIDALPFVHAVDTREATTAETDPSCSGRGPTVWYSFVAETDQRLEVNTFGSNYDTTLSVYIQDAAGIRAIGCNDDAGGVLQSRLRVDTIAGLTYLFMVGSFADGPGGDLVVAALAAPPLPELLLEEARLRQPGLVTLEGSIPCSRPSNVFVSGDITQLQKGGPKDRREPAWAHFEIALFCDGETRWTTHAVPRVGLFQRGPAIALATVTVCDEVACESFSLAKQLTLITARKADRYSGDEQGRGKARKRFPKK